MWGGRFEDGPDALMERINASINFDKRLYAQDIEGSRVHSTMLARQGIIDKKEADLICEGLSKILLEIESGEFEFKESLEDIHTTTESRLLETTGPAPGKQPPASPTHRPHNTSPPPPHQTKTPTPPTTQNKKNNKLSTLTLY